MGSEQKTLALFVSPETIALSGLNPRKDFNKDGISELAESIRSHGIVEPLVVRPDGKRYQLVAGERRLKAAQLIGLEKVPVVVRRDISDDEVLEVMLLENLQREELKPLEEASALQALLERSMTQEDLARRIGKSQGWVSGRIRLLKLPAGIQEHLRKGDISIEQAMTFLPFVDWPIANAMAKGLGKLIEQTSEYHYSRDITIQDIDQIKRDALRSSNNALRLKDWDYNLEEVMKYFPKKDCKGCKIPISIEHYGSKIRTCLDVKCFRPKLNEARKKRKVKEGNLEKLAEAKDGIDISRLRSQNYREFGKRGTWNAPKFDISGCRKCEAKKKAKSYGTKTSICIKPSCFEKKQARAKKELRARNLKTIKLVKQNLPQFLDLDRSLDDNELRFAIGLIANECNSTNYLKAWVKRPKDWRTAIKGIPPSDLRKALLGTIIMDDIESVGLYGSEDAEESLAPLKAFLPQLFEGELSAAELARIQDEAAGGRDEFDGDEEEDEDLVEEEAELEH